MNIIILGSNSISVALAEILCAHNHDITLISEDNKTLASLEHRLDIKTVHGKPCYPQVLHQAQAHAADILIAATNNDELNITACQIAYSLFKVSKKIAVINASNYFANQQLFTNDNIPVDIAINSNQLIANAALNIIQPSKQNTFIPETDLQYAEITIKNLPSQSYATYKKLSQHYDVAIPIIKGSLENLEKKVNINDKIGIVGKPKQIQSAITELTQPDNTKKRIIIAGGNQVASSLASMCAHKHHLIIIENCKNTCQKLANLLPNTTIINGNPNDDNLLQQININSADIFLALTEDDEDNILASLQAKHLGAKSATTIIRKNNYLSILDQKIIDNILFPKKIIQQFITPLTRKSFLQNTILTSFGNVEILNISINQAPAGFLEKNKDLIFASIKQQALQLNNKEDYLVNCEKILMIAPNEKTLLRIINT